MREILYISDEKLRQFVDERPSLGHRFGGDAEISILNVIKLTLTSTAVEPDHRRYLSALLKQADRAIAEMERSPDRTIKEVGDPTLTAGDWIQFDDHFNHGELQDAFAMCKTPQEGNFLLLHGSTWHLVRNMHIAKDEPNAWQRRRSRSDFSELSLMWSELVLASRPRSRFSWLARVLPKGSGRSGAEQRAEVLSLAERAESFDQSGVFAGYALVTGILENELSEEVVFATPLYIERA